MLTNHFAVNYVSCSKSQCVPTHLHMLTIAQGMPYKYVVDVNSKPFAAAPKPILDALHRLTWAGQKSVSDGTFLPFNEMLTLGYFEGQKIGVTH